MKTIFISVVAILMGLILLGYLVIGTHTASAAEQSECSKRTPLGDGSYYTLECCAFNTDDQGNIISTPKCIKYVCKSSDNKCAVAQRPVKLPPELLNPPSAVTKGGELGTTAGIQEGGGSLSTQGSETNQTSSNFTSGIPLNPPLLNVNPQQVEHDNNTNSS